jgi:hypothetical protein
MTITAKSQGSSWDQVVAATSRESTPWMRRQLANMFGWVIRPANSIYEDRHDPR